ncbi:hypothetical protein B296_00007590 [Ensete ventricosum]|uniref:FAR1 domain-containing protein n=1 Tax=Ensete ventricosum TaxID=4639 RepID=A0A427B917_ENSVE|nr:hypothetical protein B296_00007590 [Ensete ventricosum]
MVFKNHQEVSKFYKRYARRVGFGIAIRRSAFTEDGHCLYLELMCCKGGRKRPEPKYRKRNSAKTNCPARIKVKLWGDGMLHLVVANIDHNHPVSPSMARFLTCYRQLSGAAKKHAERNKDGEIAEPNLPPRMSMNVSMKATIRTAISLYNLLLGGGPTSNYSRTWLPARSFVHDKLFQYLAWNELAGNFDFCDRRGSLSLTEIYL